jgi:mRNA interferase MazF
MQNNNKPPARGDIVHSFDFSRDQQGNEIQKIKPALVITPLEYNKKYSIILCCPITSNEERRHPWNIPMPRGFVTRGTILVNQLRAFDQKARKFEIVEKLPKDILQEVLSKILPLVT